MRTALLIAITCLITYSVAAQVGKIAPPAVVNAGVPFYPPLARAARVEGTVVLKVTTDGERVLETHIEKGNALLGQAADQNLRTWRFRAHAPTTFIVTYRYMLRDQGDPENSEVLLRFPDYVEVRRLTFPGTQDGESTIK